jgi:hypothetical protein
MLLIQPRRLLARNLAYSPHHLDITRARRSVEGTHEKVVRGFEPTQGECFGVQGNRALEERG